MLVKFDEQACPNLQVSSNLQASLKIVASWNWVVLPFWLRFQFADKLAPWHPLWLVIRRGVDVFLFLRRPSSEHRAREDSHLLHESVGASL